MFVRRTIGLQLILTLNGVFAAQLTAQSYQCRSSIFTFHFHPPASVNF